MSPLQFTTIAKTVASAARAGGLRAPDFRTPPSVAGSARTLRRSTDGSALVSVVIRGRDSESILRDLVEGVIVANDLVEPIATAHRVSLLEASHIGVTKAA